MASCRHRRLQRPWWQEGAVMEDGWMDGFMIEKKNVLASSFVICQHLSFIVISVISMRNKYLNTTCSLNVPITQFSKTTSRKDKNLICKLHNYFV